MKFKIALFFFTLFVGVITAPTVISLVNENQDVSFFLNLNEEEEETLEVEDFKNITICSYTSLTLFFRKIQKRKNARFTSKKYTSLFQKIFTPPPEFVL